MQNIPLPQSPYQVGGSLPAGASNYVTRQADRQLYQALLRGEFCYVFNARQMGKSSLRVQTMRRLSEVGVRCVAIDLTMIGTQQISAEQWYASLAAMLTEQLQLPIQLGEWWRNHNQISFIGRWRLLLETVLFPHVNTPIVIFIDEVDSVLGLPFEARDFFAFIRSCYNQRADHPDYQRLSVVLLGVTTPAALIRDIRMTPFNIGLAIELDGFQRIEAMPLAEGLTQVTSHPRSLLRQILNWTGGQPFLTQKLCHLVLQYWADYASGSAVHSASHHLDSASNPPHLAEVVAQIVADHILHHWESQDEPEHLRTIRDRLIHDPQQMPQRLRLYQKLLLSPEGRLPLNNSPEQRDLLLSGLVHPKQGCLQVKNPIYEAVFNLDWIDQQLAPLMATATSAGEPLPVVPHSLDPPPHTADRHEPSSSASLGAPPSAPSTKVARPAWWLYLQQPRTLILGWLSTGVVLLGWNVWQGQQLRQMQYQQVTTDRTAAIVLAQQQNWQPALFHGLRAYQMAQSLRDHLPEAERQQLQQLQQQFQNIVYQAVPSDRLRLRLPVPAQHFTQASFYPDQPQVLLSDRSPSTAQYRQLSLWQRNGQLHQHWSLPHQLLAVHPEDPWLVSVDHHQLLRWSIPPETPQKLTTLPAIEIRQLLWSQDGTTLVLGQTDGRVQLRAASGQHLMMLQAHTGTIYSLVGSPTENQFASAGADGQIHLWQMDGQRVHTIDPDAAAIALAFSHDGRVLVGLLENGQVIVVDMTRYQIIERWTPSPERSASSQSASSAQVPQLAVNHNGSLLAIATPQGDIHLYTPTGVAMGQLPGDASPLTSLAFSGDSHQLLSANTIGHVYLWDLATAVNPQRWLAYACQQLQPYLQSQPGLSRVDRQRCDTIAVPG
jgi:hypothetical protein